MTAALFIGSFFLMLILIAMLTFGMFLKTWVFKKDKINEERFLELKERIDETQSLFRNEISDILNNIKDILKK